MPIRIGGLVSGNDYASMVDQLMQARRIPIQAKEVKRSELDYDLGAWTEVNSSAGLLAGSLDNLRGFELWRSMSSTSADESVVTATAATASAEQQYTVVVSSLAKAQSISSDVVDIASDLIANGYVQEGDVFEIEGEQVTIEAGETLSSLRTKINSAALAMAEENRVQASIVNNHLVLTRENTGAASIALSDVTGNALQSLGVLDGAAAIKNENVGGADAQFTVNGISVSRSSNNKLTDVVEGLTINLKGAGTSVLDIHPDREAIKAAILEFVDKYNDLSALVNEYSKVELGESSELALAGELYGDALINSIRLNLRKFATGSKSPVLNDLNASYAYKGQTGVMDNLSDIGIWTVGEKNQLSMVDGQRLDDMLENEFENMEQLFKGIYNDEAVAFQDGVASDFYSYTSKLSESLTGDIAKRIEFMTGKYDTLSEEINEMENALGDYEQKMWDEFTRMEDALANMDSQLNYINAMFGNNKK